jgi:hypothetical protein
MKFLCLFTIRKWRDLWPCLVAPMSTHLRSVSLVSIYPLNSWKFPRIYPDRQKQRNDDEERTEEDEGISSRI